MITLSTELIPKLTKRKPIWEIELYIKKILNLFWNKVKKVPTKVVRIPKKKSISVMLIEKSPKELTHLIRKQKIANLGNKVKITVEVVGAPS